MSQLGMMVIAIGLSSYNVALFHLVNHAFYKGLLFLGAGAVIHAVGDNQDFRKGCNGKNCCNYYTNTCNKMCTANTGFSTKKTGNYRP